MNKQPSNTQAGLGRMQESFPAEVAAALRRYEGDHSLSAALELMYLAQTAYGWLSAEAVGEVASLLGVDPTHVGTLVRFYKLLMDRPHGRWVIHVCTDLPCALRGSEDLLRQVCQLTGAAPGETSSDGLFTVLATTCLASCDRAPAMQVNLTYYGSVTPERVEAIIAELRRKAISPPEGMPPYGATGEVMPR